MRSMVAMIGIAIVTASQAQPIAPVPPPDPPAPLPESPAPSIGYTTVEEALAALAGMPGAEVSEEDGWTIIAHQEADAVQALWWFTPPGHPAHPSAVKRTVVERAAGTEAEVAVLCQAQERESCEQLARDFQEINDKLMREPGPPPP